MERVRNRFLVLSLVFTWMLPASAGTYQKEYYPNSKFGSPPADPAIHEKGELRAPAGLIIKDIKSQETKKRAMQDAFGNRIDRAGTFSSLVPDSKKGVQEVALIAGDLGFFPKTIFVTRDVPVRIFVTGASDNTLCLMMDSFNVRKQVKSKTIQEITFTPSAVGIYRFHCPINNMEGRLIVKELFSASR